MKRSFSPPHLILFVFLLVFLLVLIQIEILAFAFAKLGLPPTLGFLVMLLSLFGSAVNLPVMSIKSDASPENIIQPTIWGLLKIPVQPFRNETLIAVNLGGCLIPVVLSIYLFFNSDLGLPSTVMGIVIVTMVSYYFSRLIPGVGIVMPILIAPICAALVGMSLSPEQAAPLAYISGTIGVLIGADLFHMKSIPKLGTPFASIGGAGTFDGIFITGVVAALLV